MLLHTHTRDSFAAPVTGKAVAGANFGRIFGVAEESIVVDLRLRYPARSVAPRPANSRRRSAAPPPPLSPHHKTPPDDLRSAGFPLFTKSDNVARTPTTTSTTTTTNYYTVQSTVHRYEAALVTSPTRGTRCVCFFRSKKTESGAQIDWIIITIHHDNNNNYNRLRSFPPGHDRWNDCRRHPVVACYHGFPSQR